MSGTKQNQKGVSLLSKVMQVLLSSQTLAENTLGGQKFFSFRHILSELLTASVQPQCQT